MSDSQLAWHHLARDKPACPWHDNEMHTYIQAHVETHTDIHTHAISPSLLRYKEMCGYREAQYLYSSVHQIPVETTGTQQDPLFMLETRVGKEIHWKLNETQLAAGEGAGPIFGTDFYLKCSAGN